MSQNGSLVASGSDDNSISLYVAWKKAASHKPRVGLYTVVTAVKSWNL